MAEGRTQTVVDIDANSPTSQRRTSRERTDGRPSPSTKHSSQCPVVLLRRRTRGGRLVRSRAQQAGWGRSGRASVCELRRIDGRRLRWKRCCKDTAKSNLPWTERAVVTPGRIQTGRTGAHTAKGQGTGRRARTKRQACPWARGQRSTPPLIGPRPHGRPQSSVPRGAASSARMQHSMRFGPLAENRCPTERGHHQSPRPAGDGDGSGGRWWAAGRAFEEGPVRIDRNIP